MYEIFTEEMGRSVSGFDLAYEAERDLRFADDCGVLLALAQCLTETKVALGASKDRQQQDDLRTIFRGIECLMELLEEVRP